jgi:hypothetical protein
MDRDLHPRARETRRSVYAPQSHLLFPHDAVTIVGYALKAMIAAQHTLSKFAAPGIHDPNQHRIDEGRH